MNAVEKAQSESWRRTYFNLGSLPFWSMHLAAVIGVAAVGISWSGVAIAAALYFARMFLVTGVYHRYFSHRSYKTSRPLQFILAALCTTTLQKGVLWWAAHHRHHHKRSDLDDDIHSPVQGGFWWSHLGWLASTHFEGTDYDKVKDFARYPELRWINRNHLLMPITCGVLLYVLGGAEWLVWGGFVSTVMLWHGTFTINSLAHVIGSRRYNTEDDSRNHWLLALVTMGEGWHNNHHHYQLSCRQGFRWYEIDPTYYILRLMALFGLIWDVRTPPAHIVADRPKDFAPAVSAVSTSGESPR
ncbi:MAG: fatty acid desaturase [Myxococcota bacterium]